MALPSGNIAYRGPVVIDGSMLEGGGQILRNAAALAAILGTELRVENIRAGRKHPGLRPQHLSGLLLITQMCGGTLDGGMVGSNVVTLKPGALQPGSFAADTQTAGSCMLMAQGALPCAVYANRGIPPPADDASGYAFNVELNLRGGTDAAMAPPFGYTEHVLLPALRRQFGLSAHMEAAHKRGFFPKGGGSVTLRVGGLPAKGRLQPLQLTERGQVISVFIEAISCGRMRVDIAEHMAAAAEKALKDDPALSSIPISTKAWQPSAVGDGGSIVLVAETDTGCIFGASALAERGATSEDVGRRAGEALVEALATGACVDEWLQDQLIIFMALAEGTSTMLCGEPTLHTRTAIEVAKLLTSAEFKIEKECKNDERYMITCTGAAVEA